MSSVRFTEEQQKVIDTRQRNLLVSAAAGSGKTAVLVERIIQMLMDPVAPTPINNLLVVTFTNAAASEMRERIGQALYKAIELDPSNTYLQQQLTLLPSAMIMTLHAFCLTVIKNHFYRIDLDPGFKIGDEAELLLMKQEVLEEVLEALYEEKDPGFFNLVEAYARGKSDDALESLVMSIYRMSRSHPRPSEWLAESLAELKFVSLDQWYKSMYIKFMLEKIDYTVKDLIGQCNKTFDLIEEDERLMPMAETIRVYLEHLLALEELKNDPEALFAYLTRIELPRAKSAKRGTDPELVEPVKQNRDLIKDRINELIDKYGHQYDQQFLNQMEISYAHMATLVKVVELFTEAFSIKKLSQYILDFNDIEHYALKILLDEEGKPSEVASFYQDQFNEVLVDEYQDSNLVQETLVTSVSRVVQGNPNIFMVGDMKQSIYKFRLAKPELFADKYANYTYEDGPYQKIELHKNFRSREEVITMTNYLFWQLMSQNIGDVTYDQNAALHKGARYEGESEDYRTEILLIEKEAESMPSIELEAMHIAVRIEKLVHQPRPMMIFDKDQGINRQITYKDIVILLRTMSGWSETFVAVLKAYGIPVISNTSTGYFDTIEIQTMLNFLRLVDNPKQDIPLLAVLRSPVYDLTGDELVTLRMADTKVDFHSAMMLYHDSLLGETALGNKLEKFVDQLDGWRKLKNELGIYELTKRILYDTGYDDYIALMPGGLQRTSNMKMFMDLVYKYEQSSYKGLYHFLQYMENMHRQSVDYGEARLDQDSKNQVTIMSIHGSKGLEYPVVFVGGLSKQFNKMDLKQSVLLHQDYGFGTDHVLIDDRQIITSPTKQVIKDVMERELKSEELRILYVALTRAREKLILVATVKDIPKQLEKWHKSVGVKDIALPRHTVEKANTYLDWLMCSTIRHPSMAKLLKEIGINQMTSFDLGEVQPCLEVKVLSDIEPISMKDKDEEQQEDFNLEMEALKKRMSWTYEHQALEALHLSQSVSELKRMEMEESVYVGYQVSKPELRPLFVTGEQALTGAEKGTVFHKVMDHVNFEHNLTGQDCQDMIIKLVEQKVITQKEAMTINHKGIIGFIESDLGLRIQAAAMTGDVYKEQPFVMGIKASEIAEVKTEDYVMIQGVVDLYFQEEDDLVIVDYKTDYMKDINEADLVERYKSQMKYYKRALEQNLNKKVKEVYLYAVGVQKVIPVEL